MQLKTIPEDFIVVEQAKHVVLEKAPNILLEMTKRNITTERALSMLADRLDIPRRLVGYAGTKDARALTKQYVTVKYSPHTITRVQNFVRDQVHVRFIGYVQEPLGLGNLDSNRFEIVVRKIKDERIIHLTKIPNYFDEQRFSTANVEIGRLILKKDFVEAAKKIISTDQYAAEKMQDFMREKPTDGVGALRMIPKHTLLMYVHAYQSWLYNLVLAKYIISKDSNSVIVEGAVKITVPTKDLDDVLIPLVGFGSDTFEPFTTWYHELLDKEGLDERDFIVRSIPYLSCEGGERTAFFSIENLEISDLEDDDMHPGLYKQRLSFVLPKGCYATMVIKCLYKTGDIKATIDE